MNPYINLNWLGSVLMTCCIIGLLAALIGAISWKAWFGFVIAFLVVLFLSNKADAGEI
jgi:hypothetical protein